MSAPTTDTLKFGRSAPRQPGENDRTALIGYVEIPNANPENAVAVVDVASGTVENAQMRGVTVEFTGETGPVTVTRNYQLTDTGPSTAPHSHFYLPPTAPRVQETLTHPIALVRVEEEPNGAWIPLVHRGVFYRIWKMNSAEASGSWLRTAGFQDGQYLALQYSTELDYRQFCANGRWTSSGGSGGGGLWRERRAVTLNAGSRTIQLNPTGKNAGGEHTRILSLGGVTTDTHIELLTEAPQYNGSTLLAPGAGGVLDSMSYQIYPAQRTDVTVGRLPAATPIGSGIHAFANFSVLLTDSGASISANNAVVRYKGSFFAPTESYYTFQTHAGGKIRFLHWNLPVVDAWYGPTNIDNTAHDQYYSPYLHAGWHDIEIDWAPEDVNSTFSLTVHGPSGYHWASSSTTRSLVQQLDPNTGTITLKQSFVGGSDSLNTPEIRASYGYTTDCVPYRGYFNGSDFEDLDLNPSANRLCGGLSGAFPTRVWATDSSCWIYIIPSMACALTDAAGTPLNTGSRSWVSCLQYGLQATLQWKRVQAPLASGDITIPFGSGSSFDAAVLGHSVYSANGVVAGVNTQTDPRGVYNSASILGHLNVVAGTPTLDSVRFFDLRSRGGGLSHEVDPSQLPAGGPRERAETFWDVSPWDGYESSVNGTVIVDIPQAVLDGSDGGPIFTTQEVETLVRDSIPAGIRPIIRYIP